MRLGRPHRSVISMPERRTHVDEAAQLSQLIGDVYDAALDSTLWPGVLEQTALYVQGVTASLVSQDAVAQHANLHFHWGADPYYHQLYNETYMRLHPLLPLVIAGAKAGEVASTAMLMPHEEFVATRFYKEWARPQGYCDAVWAVLDRTATGMATLSVLRHERQGLVDEDTRRRMALIAPHFRRAVAVGRTIELRTADAAVLTDTLDVLAAGVFVVDADGVIVRMNAAAERLLERGDLFQPPRRRLTARDPAADLALKSAFAGAGGGDAAIGTMGVAVPLAQSDDEEWVAHVLPLTAGTRRNAGPPRAAVAAAFVHRATLARPTALEAIAQRYRLTPTEMRVLFAIVEIGGVPEVAPVLGISEETVKTHLGRLFRKTGTKRQADLVKLVASFANPLV
jgi:DNA-binding CsgD family transcriptional regulator/PAS domain-containing protein